jgi:subtilisin family serine protease
MEKNYHFILAGFMLLASCQKQATDHENVDASLKDPQPFTAVQIDEIIQKSLQKNNRFEWSDAGTQVIWSAGNTTDQIYAIGYKPLNKGDVDADMATIDIQSAEWKEARRQVLQLIYDEEKKSRTNLDVTQMEVWPETVLPVMDIRIERYATIEKLKSSGLVRYVEPMGFEYGHSKRPQFRTASSSGCGSNTATAGLIEGIHFNTTAPGTKASWNYNYHGIQQAWTKATGSGIKVFIIDTGTSPDQDNLGAAFNQGSSFGRTIEKIVTLPRSTFLGIPTGPVETPADGCGHGTSMAGACLAPRGVDGAATGVAYNASLVACRAAEDVLIDDSRENKGVADAFVNAGNRSDVRIISMSMGRITSNSQIADAVRYAFGKGKLIFCAGGTSFSWTAGWYGVIFPAYMNEVQAVTGVIENTNFTNCTECHKGAEIDFVVVMQRSADGVKPLTLAMSGNPPGTVGGSSVATATTAGMAALVWSRYPSLTRTQLISRLQLNSSRYPTRSPDYGWGLINANTATN